MSHMLKVAAAAVLFALTMCAPAHAKICGETVQMDLLLGDIVGQESIGVGLAPAGTAAELLVSEEGDWSFVLSTPQGVSCIIAIGKNWQTRENFPVAPPKPKDPKNGT